MRFVKALAITRSWIAPGDPADPSLAAALAAAANGRLREETDDHDPRLAAALRQVAHAARRSIPSTDVIATRAAAKRALRAVAALERRAAALDALAPRRRILGG